MNTVQVKEKLVKWIREQVLAAGARGTVVGLSGGIDSAVVAALCQEAFPDNNLGVIMPCDSSPEDAVLAKELAESIGVDYVEVDLTDTFHALTHALAVPEAEKMAVANIKPRLRMTTLYFYAAQKNCLVAGTGNRSELYTGYFTKYGDGGVDIEPIGALVKTEVRKLAAVLGVPKRIIDRPPTAGLWSGQTDEEEMTISYEELDRYIESGSGSERVKAVAQSLHQQSEHKRKLPPVCKV